MSARLLQRLGFDPRELVRDLQKRDKIWFTPGPTYEDIQRDELRERMRKFRSKSK